MNGETKGVIRVVLRLEGLCVFIAALYLYSKLGLSWITFAIFFLSPDLSFLGYFAGAKVGSIFYNITHSYIGSFLCLVTAYFLDSTLLLTAGIIWVAHIGFDRSVGYGLKYAEGFGYTHLGKIGKVE